MWWVIKIRKKKTMNKLLKHFAGFPRICSNINYIAIGIHKSNCIQCAIDAGFIHILSVERTGTFFNPPKFEEYKYRHNQEMPNITFLSGQAVECLPLTIHNTKEPITFYLNCVSRYSTRNKKLKILINELDIIEKNSTKTNIILINGFEQFKKEEIIFDKLRQINPNYEFILLDAKPEKKTKDTSCKLLLVWIKQVGDKK